MIKRTDIITGLIQMRFTNLPEHVITRMHNLFENKSNDFICDEYFKATGNYIRQIFHDTFISLT